MSAPKPKDASAHDPVIDAIDNAPLDADALSPLAGTVFAILGFVRKA